MKDKFETVFESENKLLFLEYLRDSDLQVRTCKVMVTVIMNLSEYEAKINKSVSKMSKEEVLDFLKETNSASVTTIKVYFSVLNQYVSLIDNENEVFKNIDIVDFEKCINSFKGEKKVITEKEYIKILRLKEADKTINYQDLAMLVLLWRGIRGTEYSDIAEFKKKDFDYENATILYQGRQIKILPIEAEILKRCIEEKTYRHYGSESKEETIVDLVSESENLFKETDHYNADSKLSYSSIKIRLSYFIRSKIGYILALDIYASGVVYNILKENGFKKMKVVDLDTKIKQAYQKISYNKLKSLQEEMLKKIDKENSESQ